MEKNGLLKTLEEIIITEGRVEKVLEKYKDQVIPEIVDKFVEAQNSIDRSIDNKYLDWMVKEYINSPTKINDIISIVEKWHKNLDKIDSNLIVDIYPDFSDNKDLVRLKNTPKDILSYKNLDILNYVAIAAEKKPSKKELDDSIKRETRLVYEDSNFTIRVPLTWKASCKYGSGTKWCVTNKESDNHFRSYTKEGILFFVIDKTKPNTPEHPLYKVAVHMNKSDGKSTIWNAPDTNIGTKLDEFFPPQMIKAMNDYRNKYVIDLVKLGENLSYEIQKSNLKVNDWVITGNTKKTWFKNGNYKITINMNLKESQMLFALTSIISETVLYSQSIEIPGELVKEIEDIHVDNKNENELNQWMNKIYRFISDEMTRTIIPKVQPVINQNNLAIELNRQLESEPITNWPYKINNVPTSMSPKIEIKAIGTVVWEKKDWEYTFTGIVDFNRKEFVFKSIENNESKDMEMYDDQITPFPSNFGTDVKKSAITFINWVDKLTKAVTDVGEVKEQTNTKPVNVKKLVGKYTSLEDGEFTVEVDDSNPNDVVINIYGKELGTHLIVKTAAQFMKQVERYGLKKVK